MWILMLNNMQDQTENRTPIARAETKEQLVNFVNNQKVDVYMDVGHNMFNGNPDHQYRKCFRKDGPLEWFNPPVNEDDDSCYVDVGTFEEWMQKAEAHWNEQIMSISSI